MGGGNKRHLCVWGHIREPEPFSELINEVSQLTKGIRPRFTPHITLLGSQVALEEKDAFAAVNGLVEGDNALQAIPLKLRNLTLGAEYYKCIYVTIDPLDRLNALHKTLAGTNGVDLSTLKPFDPHISVVYGECYNGKLSCSSIASIVSGRDTEAAHDLTQVTKAFGVDLKDLMKSHSVAIPDEFCPPLILDRVVVMDCPLDDITKWECLHEVMLPDA